MLPELIKVKRSGKLKWFYICLTVGIFLTFTRTALYGLCLSLFFIFLWYAGQGKLILFTRKGGVIFGLIFAGVVIVGSGVVGVSEYTLHKMDSFFNQSEILEGGSSSFRIMAILGTLDAFLANGKTILIGNGWGQAYVFYGGEMIPTSGGDLLTILAFGGVLGGVAYVLFFGLAFVSAMRVAKSTGYPYRSLFAEGVMFALVAVFITGQMATFLITPEFWMLTGISIYLSALPRNVSHDVSPNNRKRNA